MIEPLPLKPDPWGHAFVAGLVLFAPICAGLAGYYLVAYPFRQVAFFSILLIAAAINLVCMAWLHLTKPEKIRIIMAVADQFCDSDYWPSRPSTEPEIICRSGLRGWRRRLKDNYDGYQEWEDHSNLYGLAERLGYRHPIEAWRDNPLIEGSVKPSDFRRVPQCTDDSCDASHCPGCGSHKLDWYASGYCSLCELQRYG